MKTISPKILLQGISFPDARVYKPYFSFIFKKWLTSSSYGPKSLEEIYALKAYLADDVYNKAIDEARSQVPYLVSSEKSLDPSKVKLLLNMKVGQTPLFGGSLYYALLMHIQANPYGKCAKAYHDGAFEEFQDELWTLSVEEWVFVFEKFGLSLKVLKNIKKRMETLNSFDWEVCSAIISQSKNYPFYAQEVFDICCQVFQKFDIPMSKVVSDMSKFCRIYPNFRRLCEGCLLDDFNRCYKNWDSWFEGREASKVSDIMDTLSEKCDGFSLDWKENMVLKLMHKQQTPASSLQVLMSLNAIYAYKRENVSRTFVEIIAFALRAFPQNASDVLKLMLSFEKTSVLDGRSLGFNFEDLVNSSYFWKKAMVCVYKSIAETDGNFPKKANLYFSLLYMRNAEPLLFGAGYKPLLKNLSSEDWSNASDEDLLVIWKYLAQRELSDAEFTLLKTGLKHYVQHCSLNQLTAFLTTKDFFEKNYDALEDVYNQAMEQKRYLEGIVQREKEKKELYERKVQYLLAKLG